MVDTRHGRDSTVFNSFIDFFFFAQTSEVQSFSKEKIHLLTLRGGISGPSSPKLQDSAEVVGSLSIFLNCKIVQKLWEAFLQTFGCQWMMPNRIYDLFLAWRWGTGLGRGRIMWSSPFLAVIWSLWRERNARCFERSSSQVQVLVDIARFLVASWVLVLPQFRGFSYDLILQVERGRPRQGGVILVSIHVSCLDGLLGGLMFAFCFECSWVSFSVGTQFRWLCFVHLPCIFQPFFE